jgi:hypothetical protein
MNENGNKTDSRNVPLMPSVARRIMEELFQRKNQWKTRELAAEVERIHLERGGEKGKQDLKSIVTKGLRMLQEDGKVQSPAWGLQRWVNSEEKGLASAPVKEIVPEIAVVAAGEAPDEEFAPQKEIGEGPEIVYVYYNPNDRKLAELEGRTMWECKVGRTGNVDASGRITGQG